MIVNTRATKLANSGAAPLEKDYEKAGEASKLQPLLRTRCPLLGRSRLITVLRIEWDSEEGHFEGVGPAPNSNHSVASVRPYVKDTEEMRIYKFALSGGNRTVAV